MNHGNRSHLPVNGVLIAPPHDYTPQSGGLPIKVQIS